MKYKHKLTIVEAKRFRLRSNFSLRLASFLNKNEITFKTSIRSTGCPLQILDAGGNWLWVTDGDYVVVRAKGDAYPCDAEVFKKIYEKA